MNNTFDRFITGLEFQFIPVKILNLTYSCVDLFRAENQGGMYEIIDHGGFSVTRFDYTGAEKSCDPL